MLSKGIPKARHELQTVACFLQVCNRASDHLIAGFLPSSCVSEAGLYSRVCRLLHVVIGPFPLASCLPQPSWPACASAHLLSPHLVSLIFRPPDHYSEICYQLRYHVTQINYLQGV